MIDATSLRGARCVVLGGGGFIGTNLLLALRAAGIDPIGFGRPPRHPILELSNIPWISGEFTDRASVSAALKGSDVVFHLLGGGIPADSNKDPEKSLVDGVLPSLELLRHCQTSAVQRLIFASSGGTVYGPANDIIKETAPTWPVNAYGVGKLTIEKYIGVYRHVHGLDAIVLRLANPYGPWQFGMKAQGVVGTAIVRALAGQQIDIWGDGSAVRDYLYVEDLTEAMLSSAVYQGDKWVFNIGSGCGRSVNKVVEDVCFVTGASTDLVVHHPSRPADVKYNVLSTDLIEHEMGWRPRTKWLEGLHKTANWIRRNKFNL